MYENSKFWAAGKGTTVGGVGGFAVTKARGCTIAYVGAGHFTITLDKALAGVDRITKFSSGTIGIYANVTDTSDTVIDVTMRLDSTDAATEALFSVEVQRISEGANT